MDFFPQHTWESIYKEAVRKGAVFLHVPAATCVLALGILQLQHLKVNVDVEGVNFLLDCLADLLGLAKSRPCGIDPTYVEVAGCKTAGLGCNMATKLLLHSKEIVLHPLLLPALSSSCCYLSCVPAQVFVQLPGGLVFHFSM